MMKKKVKVLQVIPRLGYGGAEIGCCSINLEKQMDTAEASEASKACVIL